MFVIKIVRCRRRKRRTTNYQANEINETSFPKTNGIRRTFRFCKVQNIRYLHGETMLLSRHRLSFGDWSFLAKHYLTNKFHFHHSSLIHTKLIKYLRVRYWVEGYFRRKWFQSTKSLIKWEVILYKNKIKNIFKLKYRN